MKSVVFLALIALATASGHASGNDQPPPSKQGFVDSTKEFGRGMGRTARDGGRAIRNGAKEAWRNTRGAGAQARDAAKSAPRRLKHDARESFGGSSNKP